MRELLPDNLALAERLEALPRACQPSGEELRAVRDRVSPDVGLATYVAIVAEVDPGRVRDMLAYMHLVVCEAHKHGGQGWLTYDSVLQRSHQGVSTTWDIIDPSLHTAYIACQSNNPRVPCKYYSEADHVPENCALAPAVPQTKQPQGQDRPVSNSILAACRGRRASPYSPTQCQRRCASHGTGASAPSQRLAHTPTLAPLATALTTGLKIVPRLHKSRCLKGLFRAHS